MRSPARARVAQAFEAAEVLQLGGASGTLAALGARGLEVAEAMAARLELRLPDLPWHTHRDRLAELACALGVATGTLGKLARDLALLAQSEVGEARERVKAGRGTSSTMPHKHNPVAASVALAAATRAPGLVATLLAAMLQEHERGLGGWQAEWEALPELIELTAGAARSMAEALEELEVDRDRMRANLELTSGLVFAEAVAMRLAEKLGKSEAHAVVEAACTTASAQRRSLREVLLEDPSVTAALAPADLESALRVDGDLGAARAFIERVLARFGGSGTGRG